MKRQHEGADSLQYLTLFLPRAFCCGYEHASLLPLSLRAWYLPCVTQNSDLNK